MSVNIDALVSAAQLAMNRAYCPYSNFSVGAALLTKDGKVITGGNVENASYGGTICAERSAVVRAVAEGYREFEAIAVCAAPAEPISPCGFCRQFLIEFGDMKVIMSSSTSNKRLERQLSQLLPLSFTSKDLNH
ncbi:cytidine deaminase [Onchocerca flexuosa]|uniref:Cytidine deaminase n=1 Tax=Onchocerca flexuosa TaxID=387005 RepID=A0A238BLQ4_9BILA|nr:cytidine deaminase [Onchocerca flexuosa]